MLDEQILVLASGSPRRSQLVALGNWKFEVVVSNIDESQRVGEQPQEYVLRLAKEKALAVAEKVNPDRIVIAADTTVVDGAEILGKPKDSQDAERMLKQLRGRIHQVYTGVAIFRISDRTLITELCITDVPMRAYLDQEISTYIQSGDPFDKAGAYAIQHAGFHPVKSLQGCYASVMGLPICHLLRALDKLDIVSNNNVPEACQSLLKYECPVSTLILNGEMIG